MPIEMDGLPVFGDDEFDPELTQPLPSPLQPEAGSPIVFRKLEDVYGQVKVKVPLSAMPMPNGTIVVHAKYDDGKVISTRSEHRGGNIIWVSNELIATSNDRLAIFTVDGDNERWLIINADDATYRLKILGESPEFKVCELASTSLISKGETT